MELLTTLFSEWNYRYIGDLKLDLFKMLDMYYKNLSFLVRHFNQLLFESILNKKTRNAILLLEVFCFLLISVNFNYAHETGYKTIISPSTSMNLHISVDTIPLIGKVQIENASDSQKLFLCTLLHQKKRFLELFNDPNMYYCIFSAIFQGFIAMTTLLFMLLFYELQSIRQSLSDMSTKIDFRKQNDLTRHFIDNIDYYGWKNTKNKLNNILTEFKREFNLDNSFNDYSEIIVLKHLVKILENKILLIEMIRIYLKWALPNIVIALIGIPVSKYFLNIHISIPFVYVLSNMIISIILIIFLFIKFKSFLDKILRNP